MDRQQQPQHQQLKQYAEPIPPPSAEKRAASLTRRQRIGVGTHRSTTPTPRQLSFAKPSNAPPAAAIGAPPPAPAPAPAPSPHNSVGSYSSAGGNSNGAAATNTHVSQYSFGKPLGAPPNAPLPRIPTDKRKPTSTSSSSSHTSSNSNSSGGGGGDSVSSSRSSSNSSNNTKDWLADTETDLKQDLETTKKELELIRTILWEMEMEETSSSPPLPPVHSFLKTSPDTTAAMAISAATATQQRSQRKMLMAACREYAESRRQLLRERLRQIQFWTGSRDMGRPVPSAPPGDWAVADAEWAKWLSDQAAAMHQLQQHQWALSANIEGDSTAVTWGPLPHILATFTFSAADHG
ncbi:hypothetical protein PG996_004530 [Apiospora saccharicola]|uniref:Up-regulated during septation protein 1 domain-containing protein n=1 Tax=Apiospora saccharicola TaxID=335842 RepID=A0ABR1W4G2_9PEZI